MGDRLRALRAALRGDERRVGAVTLLYSAGAGLLAFGLVAVASPLVVEATPLSVGWPLAFVVGTSTAAVLAALSAPPRVARRSRIGGAGVASATVGLLAPLVGSGLRTLDPALGTALLGALGADRLFGLAVALAAPAFALGAAVGFVLDAVATRPPA